MRLDNPAPGLQIAQPERGFRYGSEAFWLVGFALETGPVDRALDLGTGSGIAAMLLASLGVHATGIDVRPEWEPLWAKTLAASSHRAALERRDVRDQRGSWPLVVSNPPFFVAGSGPTAEDGWKAAARTETTGTLGDFVAAARRCLSPGGRACFVIPVERVGELDRPRRIVRVGLRRALVEIVEGDCERVEETEVAERHPRVAGWYAAVGARF